ncbi:MAG: hypothetical protein CVV44_11480 [Spirochaetae bacterium HGW-Spirochaetae-1]|jgi:hypothetical protein|nr:MAG: hypothetical protein CVV44_11480 [Spirochaetae bacterium HGW-Spirochaetae-1]
MLHLISDKLVELVEKHADLIVKRWIKGLLADPTTSSYTEHNTKFVENKAKMILKNMGQWISYDTTKEEIGRSYADQGKELFRMGIPLCEVHRASVVLRRTLWVFVVHESAFDSAFQLHQMRELNDRIILFFDRAEYYTIRGYIEAMHEKLKEFGTIDPAQAETIFFENSFYNK